MVEKIKPNLKFQCVCGNEMSVIDDEGFWWVHCMDTDCAECGRNSIIFTGKNNAQSIAEHWLLDEFQEDDWRKEDAQAWLNKIWKEYQQYLWDNQ